MKDQIRQLECNNAELEKGSVANQIIISNFKDDLTSMEYCIAEKDIEMWILKQEVEEASLQLVDSVVSIGIKNAANKGEKCCKDLEFVEGDRSTQQNSGIVNT